MRRICASTSNQDSSDVRVRYLRWSEIKCKLVWYGLVKEEKVQDLSMIIEIDGEKNEPKAIQKPSKSIE
jgi:hypothetical protein